MLKKPVPSFGRVLASEKSNFVFPFSFLLYLLNLVLGHSSIKILMLDLFYLFFFFFSCCLIWLGNLYMDSRQNLPPSVMPPPGYPHIPQALNTPGTTITGNLGCWCIAVGTQSLILKSFSCPSSEQGSLRRL